MLPSRKEWQVNPLVLYSSQSVRKYALLSVLELVFVGEQGTKARGGVACGFILPTLLRGRSSVGLARLLLSVLAFLSQWRRTRRWPPRGRGGTDVGCSLLPVGARQKTYRHAARSPAPEPRHPFFVGAISEEAAACSGRHPSSETTNPGEDPKNRVRERFHDRPLLHSAGWRGEQEKVEAVANIKDKSRSRR